jgi:F-type H+-transporting ATPase subunit delta
VYARALVEAARDKGSLEAVRVDLGDLVHSLDEVPELDRVLADREVETTAKVALVEQVLAGSNPLVRNLAALLAEKGRAAEIREVAAEFEALLGSEQRVLSVEVTTAHELSEEEFGRILADIERKSGQKVSATRTVEPDLIGGIVLQAGSLRLDASVRGQFERLRRQLRAAV